jgi:hypothetical protein
MLEDDCATDNRNLLIPVGLPILVLVPLVIFIIARRRGH